MSDFAACKDLIAIIVTIAIAIAGLAAKYINDLAIARRRDRLERTNQQLRLLYGPLLALNYASSVAWKNFREQYRPGVPYFSKSKPPSDQELVAWRLWMTTVFMPLNRRMTEAILNNADLIDGDVPQEFLALIAHVATYETILEKWKSEDYLEHAANITFPAGAGDVIKNEYEKLRARQRKLLASN